MSMISVDVGAEESHSYAVGTTVGDIVLNVHGRKHGAVAALVDGVERDFSHVLEADCSVEPIDGAILMFAEVRIREIDASIRSQTEVVGLIPTTIPRQWCDLAAVMAARAVRPAAVGARPFLSPSFPPRAAGVAPSSAIAFGSARAPSSAAASAASCGVPESTK